MADALECPLFRHEEAPAKQRATVTSGGRNGYNTPQKPQPEAQGEDCADIPYITPSLSLFKQCYFWDANASCSSAQPRLNPPQLT